MMRKFKWSEMAEWIAFAAILLGSIVVIAAFVASGLNVITPEQAVVACSIGAVFMVMVPIVCFHKR